MQKKVRKLELGRETLRLLEVGQNTQVLGGVITDTCTQWESCGGTCLSRCTSCC